MTPDHLWNLLPLPAFVIDAEDRIQSVNIAAESFLGAGGAQIVGRSIEAIFGETDRIVALVRRTRELGNVTSDRDVAFTRLGRAPEKIDLLSVATEDAGEVLLLFQIRSFAEDFDRSLNHRHAARSMSGMAAMLAHEIKNPLAGISGAAQLLELSASDEELQLTRLIRDETRRVADLIDRMETFGAVTSLRREPVNIHDVLDRAKRSAEAGFARGIQFREEYDPSLPEVPGDHDQLVQVMLNLLKNAAEAAPPVGGAITLRTAFRPGFAMAGPSGHRTGLPLLVQITDNGAGIPAEMQQEIFEPFVTTKTRGGGLGLSVVSRIIADHGGMVDCVSRPGRTTFRLRLPVWREIGSEGG
ncbi:two-component system sensor histidine kinase NtrB [Pikeienuella sp. HZG-20]|uniref:two-component system sensor histidine kinase NtrB n=1 Tax=Paludibacillus litoralis TaxID=3133267 RepID=UPI0030ED574A